jgi:hypothetical protein
MTFPLSDYSCQPVFGFTLEFPFSTIFYLKLSNKSKICLNLHPCNLKHHNLLLDRNSLLIYPFSLEDPQINPLKWKCNYVMLLEILQRTLYYASKNPKSLLKFTKLCRILYSQPWTDFLFCYPSPTLLTVLGSHWLLSIPLNALMLLLSQGLWIHWFLFLEHLELCTFFFTFFFLHLFLCSSVLSQKPSLVTLSKIAAVCPLFSLEFLFFLAYDYKS